MEVRIGIQQSPRDVVFETSAEPEDLADAISEVKWGTPSITSLQGKLLMYGGLAGYAIYAAAWLTAWRATPAGHPARYLIPAVYLSSLFSLAPFFLPHVWIWLAFGATSQQAEWLHSPYPRPSGHPMGSLNSAAPP